MKASYYFTTYVDDLKAILQLQQLNLPGNLDEDEIKQEGYVTVHHNFNLLNRIHGGHGHVVAKNENSELIGYALVMLKDFRNEIPVLVPMFNNIDQAMVDGEKGENVSYCIMGQVCIDKQYRGHGIFAGLYQHLFQGLENHFDYVITEVSQKNPRSIRAHEKMDFFTIVEGSQDNGEKWNIIAKRI